MLIKSVTQYVVMFVITIFMLVASTTKGITYQEAMKSEENQKLFIKYDRTEFNQWMHLGIALVISYSLLTCIWGMVNVIYRFRGGKSRSRKRMN